LTITQRPCLEILEYIFTKQALVTATITLLYINKGSNYNAYRH